MQEHVRAAYTILPVTDEPVFRLISENIVEIETAVTGQTLVVKLRGDAMTREWPIWLLFQGYLYQSLFLHE